MLALWALADLLSSSFSQKSRQSVHRSSLASSCRLLEFGVRGQEAGASLSQPQVWKQEEGTHRSRSWEIPLGPTVKTQI